MINTVELIRTIILLYKQNQEAVIKLENLEYAIRIEVSRKV